MISIARVYLHNTQTGREWTTSGENVSGTVVDEWKNVADTTLPSPTRQRGHGSRCTRTGRRGRYIRSRNNNTTAMGHQSLSQSLLFASVITGPKVVRNNYVLTRIHSHTSARTHSDTRAYTRRPCIGHDNVPRLAFPKVCVDGPPKTETGSSVSPRAAHRTTRCWLLSAQNSASERARDGHGIVKIREPRETPRKSRVYYSPEIVVVRLLRRLRDGWRLRPPQHTNTVTHTYAPIHRRKHTRV